MRLVLDTNILIAALIKDSLTRDILFLPDNDRAFERLSGIKLWKTSDIMVYLQKGR